MSNLVVQLKENGQEDKHCQVLDGGNLESAKRFRRAAAGDTVFSDRRNLGGAECALWGTV